MLNTNHFGPLRWDGENPYMAVLEEIPYHVKLSEEDEVVTSGYSAMFPEGILIGKVVKVECQWVLNCSCDNITGSKLQST